MERDSSRFALQKTRLRMLSRVLSSCCVILATASATPGAVTSREPFEPASGSSGRLIPISPEDSGLDRVNAYEDPRMWEDRYLPSTAGAVGTGLAVGDFDRDGFPDIFLAYREGRNRLYRNEGGLRFKDVTEDSGILRSMDWTTGVTTVDIDGDRDLDLYVCFYDSPNRLYLNNGSGQFTENAARYGLDVIDASNAAYFCDYDRDGDLDLYLQTNQLGEQNGGNGRPDHLFRNDGPDGFREVTGAAGMKTGPAGATLGHSAVWFDWNGDGWDDLYVANDFEAPDFLYLNQQDGTFRDVADRLPVVPYSSMGSDVGDVNGDGLLDLLCTDMAATDYGKHVESMLPNAAKTRALLPSDRPAQVMKNVLLLNRGAGEFIDVAYGWGVAASDWTWAARLVDFDNDSWPDVFFPNGMIRQFHNADLSYKQDQMSSVELKNAVFRRSPVLTEENILLRNQEGRGFSAAPASWGYEHMGVSFGAVACDFDRDGDLDLLTSAFDAVPSLWRNDLGDGHAVQIELRATGENSRGIGALLIGRYGNRSHAWKLLSTRGYQSSDGPAVHFGLGTADQINELEIRWPDGRVQVEKDLQAGYRYVIEQDTVSEAKGNTSPASSRFRLVERSTIAPAAPAKARTDDLYGPLYPFKPIPGPLSNGVLEADFDRDGRLDAILYRPWESPQLILSTGDAQEDVASRWGLSNLSGHWERAAILDANGDGFPDVILGGLGLNNEIVYRGGDEPLLIRQIGSFPGQEEAINLSALRWDGQLRLLSGLIDLTEYFRPLPGRFGSFRKTGEINNQEFVRRSGFEVDSTQSIDRFETILLLNRGGRSFEVSPLPPEVQYGRARDIATGDVNRDGMADLVLLLGHLTPHPESFQAEASFLMILLGDGEGGFAADSLRPTDVSIGNDGMTVELKASGEEGGVRMEVRTVGGERLVFEDWR